jgi:arsenite oxidase small subunit
LKFHGVLVGLLMKKGEIELQAFNLDELKKYDGKEGKPLYLVFKGKVFDLSESRLWTNGVHMGKHSFNEKLEETIREAPHQEEVLSRFPVIGEVKQETPQEEPADEKSKASRREFLKLVAAGGGALIIVALAGALRSITFVPASSTQTSWPRLKVANINSLQPLKPVNFNYPLTNTPNLLVKLGVKAKNGIGPDSDVVAFSDICQHLGCFYGFVPTNGAPPCNSSYKAPESVGYCCCHGSIYDFTDGAKVIGGPAPRALPQVKLELDQTTGDIYAVSMGPPTIFGHGPAGTMDPTLVLQYDMSGGTLVST